MIGRAEDEAGTEARRVVGEIQLRVVQPRNRGDQAQPKTGPRGGAACIEPDETASDAVALFRGNAGPVVADRDHRRAAAVKGNGDLDPSRRRAVPSALSTRFTTAWAMRSRSPMVTTRSAGGTNRSRACLLGSRRQNLMDLACHGTEIDPVMGQIHGTRLQPGQPEDRVERRRDAVEIGQRRADLVAQGGRVGGIERLRFEPHPHPGQRRAQVVRDIGRNLPDRGDPGLQAVERGIDPCR